MKSEYIIGVVALVLIGFGSVWYFIGREPVETLPTMVVIEDGQNVGTVHEYAEETGHSLDELLEIEEHGEPTEVVVEVSETDTSETKMIQVKEIFETDGVKHSVPLEEILSGGPPKDGIPPIDEPVYWTVEEAQGQYDDSEPGIAFSHNGVDRFYPFQVLVWHEIVNDVIGGDRVLVTYCPLCLSGIVFDPLVQGERVAFGTSGKLWQSNLVMYDRKTDSYWSQILGEAIVGEMTGSQLAVLSSDMTTFGDWKALHPGGEVLSTETGAQRSYGYDPYGDYYTTPGSIFEVRASDDRLEDKDLILGIVIDGKAKAYFPPAIKEQGEITDTFAGKTIIVRYNEDLDTAQLFEVLPAGEEMRINPFPNFWFSWVAAHPDTELYQ